tara:strand:+ start:150 stop:431 length:282 start_codon:yes stop_codon:yes gene_type:complete
MQDDFFHDATPAVASARETIPDFDRFCRAKTHGSDCSGDETKDQFWMLGAGWKSGRELYLYGIHTSRKFSRNKICLCLFGKLLQLKLPSCLAK